LAPFSLSSSEVPELGDHADLGQLKQAAFTTPPGKISRFVPTADGGFILYVESLLPVDQSKKSADFQQYLAQVRRARQNEAFNLWLNTELNRELRNTQFFQDEQQANAGK
jgi:parvulin-like peptidyl-prolyl isomerase